MESIKFGRPVVKIRKITIEDCAVSIDLKLPLGVQPVMVSVQKTLIEIWESSPQILNLCDFGDRDFSDDLGHWR